MKTLKDFFDTWKNMLTEASYLEDKEGNITHLTWEWDNILYNITAPHEGNDFTYILRINPKRTFDKWDNADIEEFYDSINELSYDLTFNIWVYKALLNIYIDRYVADLGD